MTKDEEIQSLAEENLALIEEVATLRVELKRIKEGIKKCNIVLIVDGNDMCDWGWMTIRDHNYRMHEKEQEWKKQKTAV